MNDSGEAQHRQARPWLPWLVMILALSAALRLWVVATTAPHLYPDSIGYLHLARRLGQLNLSQDNGSRTPLYPLFLVSLRYEPSLVRLAQMALGLAITAAIFYIIWTLTHRALPATLGSALYGLSLAQILFESGVLTETLTTFLLVMLAADLTWLLKDRSRFPVVKLIIAGLCAGLVPLARPSYVYVPIFFLAIIFVWVPRLRRRPLLIVILAAIALVPTLAWSSFNFARFDTFGLSTMSGFDLTNKTGAYIKDAPAKYSVIRDIYVTALEARHGKQRDLIWHVIPAMEAATGQSYAQLSQTFLSMNAGLILSHQKDYWANVASVSIQFWKTTGYAPALPSLGGVTHVWWLIHKWFDRLLNVVFLLLAAYWVLRAITRRKLPKMSLLEWMAAATIVSGIVCALVIDGDNARFGMPTQPYVVCVVLVVIVSWLSPSSSREKSRSPALDRIKRSGAPRLASCRSPEDDHQALQQPCSPSVGRARCRIS